MPINSTRGAGSAKGFGFTAGGANIYIEATGGTITETDVYRIHTFSSPGSFVVSKTPDPSVANVDYLVIAGAGGTAPSGRGGSAGGFRESYNPTTSGPYTASPLASPTSITVTTQTYPITVGAKGAPQPSQNTPGNQGNPSTFTNITSAGGGGSGVGHYSQPVKGAPGLPGGCGGAAGGYPPGNSPPVAGNGNDPPTSPPQGQPGTGGANGWGGGALSQYDGAGTGINPATGEPGPSPAVKYYSGGNGQGGSGVGDDGEGGASGTGTGLVVIRYRYK